MTTSRCFAQLAMMLAVWAARVWAQTPQSQKQNEYFQPEFLHIAPLITPHQCKLFCGVLTVGSSGRHRSTRIEHWDSGQARSQQGWTCTRQPEQRKSRFDRKARVLFHLLQFSAKCWTRCMQVSQSNMCCVNCYGGAPVCSVQPPLRW